MWQGGAAEGGVPKPLLPNAGTMLSTGLMWQGGAAEGVCVPKPLLPNAGTMMSTGLMWQGGAAENEVLPLSAESVVLPHCAG